MTRYEIITLTYDQTDLQLLVLNNSKKEEQGLAICGYESAF